MNLSHIQDVTRLNLRLDPSVLFAELGERFRGNILFKEIVERKDSFGFVYLYEGKIIGYIACSMDSCKFFRDIKNRYAWQLLLMFIDSFRRSPSRAIRYLKLFFSAETGYFDDSLKAESVAFGVDPDYRTPEFYQKTGLNIAHLLFMAEMEEYQRRGINYVKFMVADNNVLTKIFYINYGLKPAKTFRFLDTTQTVYIACVDEILSRKKGVTA